MERRKSGSGRKRICQCPRTISSERSQFDFSRSCSSVVLGLSISLRYLQSLLQSLFYDEFIAFVRSAFAISALLTR